MCFLFVFYSVVFAYSVSNGIVVIDIIVIFLVSISVTISCVADWNGWTDGDSEQ